MITDSEIRNLLVKQLSIDYNCTLEDVLGTEVTVTESAVNPGRRVYSEKAPFFSMLTMGQNAVITANADILSFIREYVCGKAGFCLFNPEHLFEIQKELVKYGKALKRSIHLMYLPKAGLMNVQPEFEIKWFEQKDIGGFYGDERFPNALCDRFIEERPDMLAAAAVIDGEIAGMAGCSADSGEMWQIGIDVLPPYRSRGIGKTLVSLLRDEVLKRGFVPFYGTSPTNIHSQNIALKSGFYPAWSEINFS